MKPVRHAEIGKDSRPFSRAFFRHRELKRNRCTGPSFASSPKWTICYNVDRAIRIQETTMDLPIKFPSETEVILEDVARFRALSPEGRIQTIRDIGTRAAIVVRADLRDRGAPSPDAFSWVRIKRLLFISKNLC